MSFEHRVAVLALATLLAAPGAARAQGAGGPGCTNLPLYNRALGALQGMTSACDMSVEEARRIVVDHDGSAAGRQTAPGPQGSDRRQRMRPAQERVR